MYFCNVLLLSMTLLELDSAASRAETLMKRIIINKVNTTSTIKTRKTVL